MRMSQFTAILLSVFIVAVLFSSPAVAQLDDGKERFGAFGLGYNDSATPNIRGWMALGIPITDKVISYTAYDIIPVKYEVGDPDPGIVLSKIKLKYTFRTGLAYRIYDVTRSWSLWGLANAGFAADGQNVTASFEGGGFLHKDFGGGWGGMIILSLQRDAINGKVFNPMFGVRKKL